MGQTLCLAGYYLFALPRWERRARVAFDWTLDLIFPPDIVELKVEPRPRGAEAREAAPRSAAEIAPPEQQAGEKQRQRVTPARD